MMLYPVLKTIVIRIVSPLIISLLLMGTGVVLILFTKRQKLGKVLVPVGLVFLIVISMPMIPDLMLASLEEIHEPLSVSNISGDFSAVQYIVVLAGGHYWNETRPLSSQFNYHGLVRLVEGIRLARQFPQAKLILSGGPGNSSISEAVIMKQLAEQLGISPGNIILETESMTTADEVSLIKPILEKTPFILVTSAAHMPRALSLCRKQGLNPIAAPTGFLKVSQHVKWFGWPNTRNIDKVDFALHEYLGLLKDKFLGNI
jgi:uncharacterized SAM-binding protein YcdF (DUF218 family)